MITNTTRTSPGEYVEHYHQTMARIIELVSNLSSDDEQLVVQACPDWTVKDLVAHVAGLCEALSQGESTPADTQAWVDQLVADRASQSLSETIKQWKSCAVKFGEVATLSARIAAPITYDLIVHEHDLRHALQLPGEKDNAAVLIAMSFGALMLEHDLKNLNQGSLHLRCGEYEWQCGPGEVELSLDLTHHFEFPIWETLRLTGSRRSHRQLRQYPWQGDLASLLSGMLHMDPPNSDIHE